jgi:hypothetical protein
MCDGAKTLPMNCTNLPFPLSLALPEPFFISSSLSSSIGCGSWSQCLRHKKRSKISLYGFGNHIGS